MQNETDSMNSKKNSPTDVIWKNKVFRLHSKAPSNHPQKKKKMSLNEYALNSIENYHEVRITHYMVPQPLTSSMWTILLSQ